MALAVALSGCSLGGSKTPSKKGPAGTRPYTVRGKTYYPLLSAHGFREEGIASWYGRDFHGKTTSNGERYNMYGMTAAHKLLPFNTQVKVTNKANGRSIVVRINDRGPFVANRVIDLTRTVPGLKDGELSGRFYVQLGAFGTQANARALVSRMEARGTPARVFFSENLSFWRVQAGPYATLKQAEAASESFEAEFPSNFVEAE